MNSCRLCSNTVRNHEEVVLFMEGTPDAPKSEPSLNATAPTKLSSSDVV